MPEEEGRLEELAEENGGIDAGRNAVATFTTAFVAAAAAATAAAVTIDPAASGDDMFIIDDDEYLLPKSSASLEYNPSLSCFLKIAKRRRGLITRIGGVGVLADDGDDALVETGDEGDLAKIEARAAG